MDTPLTRGAKIVFDEYVRKMDAAVLLCRRWIEEGSPAEAGAYAKVAAQHGRKILTLTRMLQRGAK